MQDAMRRSSLNGIRAFEAAARLRSFTAAGAELGVTPSAVSHQIRQLEAAVGTKLFARRHKAVELTPEGAAFFRDVSPAIETILRARQALQRDATSVVVKSYHSFGVRWLIPRLPRFHLLHPRIQVTVETRSPPVVLGPGVDVAIPYARFGETSMADGIPLLTDQALPVKAPRLREARSLQGSKVRYPIVAATRDDWDWKYYARETGIDFGALRVVGRFDTDDAAVRATLDCLGVSMQTRAFIEAELASGALVPVGLPEIYFGEYWMVAAHPRRRATELFTLWLQREAANASPMAVARS